MKTTHVLWPTALMATATSALALGIRIADQDPFATARGDAFTATADNPSAIYYNPAGITQLEGFNSRIGVYGITFNSEYHGGGMSFDTKNDWQAVPQIYSTYKLKEWPLSLGLGVYSPYGLSNEWPDNSPFRTIAIKGEITYATIQPVIAWQTCKAFSIAIGPTFNMATADLQSGVLPAALNPTLSDRYHLRGNDFDTGFTVGAMLKLGERHSFGVTYRSPTDMDFEDYSRISGAPVPLPPPFPANVNFYSPAHARFHFPQNVIVGYSFRPTPRWNLEVDIDWTDWDSLNTVTVVQPASPTGNVMLPFDWRSSFFYEFGVTRSFVDGWRISGGYIFSENSVPDKTFNPVVPDSNRHIWSLGVGRDYNHWRWDFAYQLAWGPERTVTGNPANALGETANGRYEFLSHALSFSVGYYF